MLDDLKLFMKNKKKTTFVISYCSTNYTDKTKLFTCKIYLLPQLLYGEFYENFENICIEEYIWLSTL